MNEWWNAITLLEKIFFCIAAPATAVLLIQTVSLIFGIGEQSALSSDVSGIEGLDAGGLDALDAGGLDALDAGGLDGLDGLDVPDADVDLPDAPDGVGIGGGLRLFSIRGLIAFLTCFGWGGIAALELGASNGFALAFAIVLGAAALILMAFMVRSFLKLQQSGNDDPRSAIGRSGEVYLAIPPAGSGSGKVTLDLGSGLREFSAITGSDERIPTGVQVRVTDLARDGVFVVERE